MDTEIKNGKIFLHSALILGVCLLLGLWLLGRDLYLSRQSAGLTVTGSVKKHVDSDLAKWNASFTRQANLNNVRSVMEQSASDVKKITKFITDLGIDEKSITFLPVQTDSIYEQTQYGMTQNVIGYNIRQELRVESADIGKIDQLANEARKLVDLGIVPDYQRTEYFYTKLADLRPELFADATKDAKTRAEAIAKGSGVKVGEPISAKTGVIQILPPNSLNVEDYGAYDLSTKEKEITATVNVTFKLEK